MPNLITHMEFAREVYAKLPKEIKDVIDKNKSAYLLGSIGPDVLFALREIGDKENAAYPNMLQFKWQYEAFEAMRKNIIQTKNDTRFAYALGYICHYTADKNIHPYVNFFNENVLAEYLNEREFVSVHSLIESALDTYVLSERLGYENVNDYKANKPLRVDKKSLLEIGGLYVDALNPIYGFSLTPKKFKKSAILTKLFMLMTNDKKRRRFNFFVKLENKYLASHKISCLFRPVMKYGEVDYLNLEKRNWKIARNTKEESNKSLIELFEHAKDEVLNYYMPSFFEGVIKDKVLDKEKFIINYEGINTAGVDNK